ncbi:hypothetical protein M433DRAFT_274449 [Acidomyces richmondensis BFW]|nr:hypothetical protein M433DRAFT_274449 [Acidomyces richmondensis BFW]
MDHSQATDCLPVTASKGVLERAAVEHTYNSNSTDKCCDRIRSASSLANDNLSQIRGERTRHAIAPQPPQPLLPTTTEMKYHPISIIHYASLSATVDHRPKLSVAMILRADWHDAVLSDCPPDTLFRHLPRNLEPLRKHVLRTGMANADAACHRRRRLVQGGHGRRGQNCHLMGLPTNGVTEPPLRPR